MTTKISEKLQCSMRSSEPLDFCYTIEDNVEKGEIRRGKSICF